MTQTNISLMRGNLFDSRMQTLCNTVNTVGVMGAGIAKEFKIRYPEMFEEYKEMCAQKRVVPGEPYCWKPADGGARSHWVLNFPTKKHWRHPSKIEWLESGLQYLQENYRRWGIVSLAVPALGCSLGKLSWEQVRPLMERYLSEMDVPVEIYEPLPARKKRMSARLPGQRENQPALQQRMFQ